MMHYYDDKIIEKETLRTLEEKARCNSSKYIEGAESGRVVGHSGPQ
jgi:hypothetical protein